MTHTFEPRLDILPSEQRRLWPDLLPISRLGFVLYGGTAIALRLAHRPSVDFDFFSDAPLDREALRHAMPVVARGEVVLDRPDSLGVLVRQAGGVHSHVKLSFFGSVDFGRVGEPERTVDGVLEAASLDDLMATKAKVVLQRAEAKDYLDVAAMVSAGVSLARGLAAARALFGEAFQPSESLKALSFFGDGDLSTVPASARETLVRAVASVRELPRVEIASRRLGSGTAG